MAEALRGVARLVVAVRVGLERAGHDAEHRDAPGERIGDRLPHECRRGQFFVGGARRVAAVLGDCPERAIGRRGQIAHDRVEQLRHADVEHRRRAEERKDLRVERRRPQAGSQLGVGQRAGFEELLHQLLVVLGDHLDERLARRVDRRGHVGRHRRFAEPAACIGLEDERLLRDEIDDALEVLLLANRQLDRDHRAIARFAERLKRSIEARALAIEAVQHDQARQPELLRSVPHFFGLHHDAGNGVDDDQRRVCDLQRRARVGEEVAHPGRVDEIDLLLVPLGVGEAGGERVLAGYFLFVEVGDRRAFIDLAEAIDYAAD